MVDAVRVNCDGDVFWLSWGLMTSEVDGDFLLLFSL